MDTRESAPQIIERQSFIDAGDDEFDIALGAPAQGTGKAIGAAVGPKYVFEAADEFTFHDIAVRFGFIRRQGAVVERFGIGQFYAAASTSGSETLGKGGGDFTLIE
jgi:hypothetical protein